MSLTVDVFCVLPEGLEFLAKEEIEAAVGPEHFGGFKDAESESMPGVIFLQLRLPEGDRVPPTVAASLSRLRALRCIDRVAATLSLSAVGEIPVESKDELARLAELTRTGTGWLRALHLWSAVYPPRYAGAAAIAQLQQEAARSCDLQRVLPLIRDYVLFRVSALRFRKGLRKSKPAWKSPDAEREVGAAVCELTGWRAQMILNTAEVLVVLVGSRAVVGLVLHTPNPVRVSQDFAAKSRDVRSAETLESRMRGGEQRLQVQAEAESFAEQLRLRLVGGRDCAVQEGERDRVRMLRPSPSKDEVRLVMSENSMLVTIARGLVRLAGVGAGDVVCDPFVGCGTTLIEACLLERRCFCVGGDFQLSEAGAAAANFLTWEFLARSRGLAPGPAPHTESGAKRRRSVSPEHNPPSIAGRRLNPGPHTVCRWDATMLPLRAGSVDAVVSDLPFGNRCGTSHAPGAKKAKKSDLYGGAIRESQRVLRAGGRFVFLVLQRARVDEVLAHPDMKGAWRPLREPFRINMSELNPWVFSLVKT
eukprot:TRINITY_DN21327_c0_g1_i1.p1 TRINITY_DN21327_c0_g1~~TRINITY_DN21327_c0_g1_i1.p1  ORF type:complete len:533 (+),score=103.18 TRINITY_DN21327_c0_g1_i1:55-1653(+)